MNPRQLGAFQVNPIGLGCMNLSHAYGDPTPFEPASRLLNHALDLGYNLLDTAALYGGGENEKLLGQALKRRRHEFILASKCGMVTDAQGKRVVNGRPQSIRQECEQSLRRLQCEVIDLYYLHRRDRQVPIEESVGALGDLVKQGKIRAIGLSEVSAATLRRAHAEHPITALQSEYSLWTRNPEIAVLEACRELGVGLVAFSPLGRGMLSGKLTDIDALAENDLRRSMPRFQGEAFQHNLGLLPGLRELAQRENCSPAQLALAWLLQRDNGIIPIPGTTSPEHLEENLAATEITPKSATLEALDRLINQQSVWGARYDEATQADIDTEDFT